MQLHMFLASVKSPALPPLHVADRYLKIPVRFSPSLKAEPSWLFWSLLVHQVELLQKVLYWEAQRQRHDLGSAGWIGRGILFLGLVATLRQYSPVSVWSLAARQV